MKVLRDQLAAQGVHSLLVQFHNEGWGGEKVFQLMSKLAENIPGNRALLELMYVVLALGFEGRYRVLDNGRMQLDSVRQRLAQMLAQNPLRMNYEKKYQEIIAAYNQDKDRATIEDTFAKLLDVMAALDVEQQRAVQEGLSEDQLALFDLVQRGDLNKTERERIKQASRDLLAGVMAVIAPLDRWTEKEQTQAEVEIFMRDICFSSPVAE